MKKENKKSDTKARKKRRPSTYKKYAYDLKRRIVNDIIKGIISKEEAMLKYGIKSRQSINYWLSQYSSLNYRNQKNYGMKESLEQKVKRLEAKNEELESSLIILNMVIDIADEQFNTNIRKKHLPRQLKDFKKHRSLGRKEK